MRLQRRTLIKFGTPIALAVYGVALAALLSVVDLDGVTVDHPVVAWLPLVAALTLGNYLLRGIRFHWLMRSQTSRLPLRQAVGVFMVGLTFAATPGRVGDLVRVVLLRRWYGIQARISFPICLFDRLFDMAAVSALVLLAATLDPSVRSAYPEWWIAALITAGIIAAIVLVLALLRNPRRLPRPLKRLVGLLRFRRPVSRHVPGAFALSVGAWALEGVAVAVVIMGFGSGFNAAAGIFIHSVALLGGALTFLPGGIGGTEAAMVLLLGRVGLGLADAVVATVLVRLVTFWFAIALGAATWVAMRRIRPVPVPGVAHGGPAA